jgi:hypothetical protein
MYRVSEWSYVAAAGLLALSCATTKPTPKEDAPPASGQAASLTLEKPKLIGDPTPGQALIAVREWLAVLRGTDAKRLAPLTGYPFYSHGLLPTEGPDAEACRAKARAATSEAFLGTAECMMKYAAIRDNIPANLLVNSVFEIKVVTLEAAFKDQKELTEIWSRKKELEATCCRAFLQAYFPGDKANAYLLFAVDWINGDVRVVSVLAELDPIEAASLPASLP